MIRLVLFAGVLALVAAGAALAGSAIDPDPSTETAEDAHAPADEGHGGEATHAKAQPAAKGLSQVDDGLRLVIEDPETVAQSGGLGFRIVNADGATVRDFDVEHDRRMHLIVVRRDLSGFQHLHPEQTADGAWKVPLRLPEGGTYRVFADFSSAGEAHTLGTDLHVDGDFQSRELPHPATTAVTDSGYEVRLDQTGDQTRFTVYEDGQRVRDIEPYLGARGHLVALREGDLAFLHVHPESEASEGSDIRFAVEYPSQGRYRLFLQFKVDGKVHTAAFTREVGESHGH